MKIKPNGPNQTIVISPENHEVLYSYETPVAIITKSGKPFKTEKKWSVTTSKHINKFLVEWHGNEIALVPQSVMDQWTESSFE